MPTVYQAFLFRGRRGGEKAPAGGSELLVVCLVLENTHIHYQTVAKKTHKKKNIHENRNPMGSQGLSKGRLKEDYKSLQK